MENIEIETKIETKIEIKIEIENDICLNGYRDLPLKSIPTMTDNKPKLLPKIAGI